MGVAMYGASVYFETRMTGWATRGMQGAALASTG
jgi:hypothetical protein